MSQARKRPTHALNPPVVAVLPQHVPAIHGISPALAGFGESVRRHAGDDLGIQFGIEAENVRMRPHIGAVVADEDGDVADDADAAGGAAQSAAPATAQKMRIAENGRSPSSSRNCWREADSARPGSRLGELARPAIPALSLEAAAQGVKEHEVFQPPGIVVGETCRRRQRLVPPALNRNSRAAPASSGNLASCDAFVIHGPPGPGSGADSLPRNQSAFGQTLQADQQNVAGKGRNRRIGRVADAPPDAGAAPARAPAGPRPENRGTHRQPDRDRRCRRATEMMSDATGFRKRAGSASFSFNLQIFHFITASAVRCGNRDASFRFQGIKKEKGECHSQPGHNQTRLLADGPS